MGCLCTKPYTLSYIRHYFHRRKQHLRGAFLRPYEHSQDRGGASVVSSLYLTPAEEDHGAVLRCEATSSRLTHLAPLFDAWNITVNCEQLIFSYEAYGYFSSILCISSMVWDLLSPQPCPSLQWPWAPPSPPATFGRGTTCSWSVGCGRGLQ